MQIIRSELAEVRNMLIDLKGRSDVHEDEIEDIIEDIIKIEERLDDTVIKCKKCGGTDIWYL